MEELRTLNTTLTLFYKNDEVLLGEKKRGFAKGALIGIGGKQDKGETIEQAMIRECYEEIGLTPVDFYLVGKIHFDTWYKGEHVNMYMHIFNCTKFKGELCETDEMRPHWYKMDKIPYEKMLADDLLWTPIALKGQRFVGQVVFDKDLHMLSHNFEEVETI